MKPFFIIILILPLIACAHLPDMYKTKLLPQTVIADDSVRVIWMGTAGLYLSDGESRIFIDPFVSRYGLLKVGLGFSLKPQQQLIKKWLTITGGEKANAILISLSHYDHVMDAPYFAEPSSAMIVGSESTANVARGAGIAEDQIRIIKDRDSVTIGKFKATFIKSIHSPALFGKIPWPGDIKQPLTPPASASDYREGGAYAILIEHPKGTILHYGSPGIKPNIFDNLSADVVFLSIGGRKDTPGLLKHVITPLQPKTVIPIHFDDLFGPVDKEVTPLIGVKMDEFWRTMSEQDHLFKVNTLPIGEAIVLFP
jgi:L-ascorbate metabolism protein UlaG (beta-lactamase superfamily)